MGCEFQEGTLDKEIYKTREDVRTFLERAIEQAKHDYGHRGYTGSLAEARGIEFKNRTFETEDDALWWLIDEAPKWGPIWVVKTKTHWVYGANCSS